MSNKNDVVIIELDRPRELRFGHKALKRLTAITGNSLEDLENVGVDLEQIEKYLYCGLLSDAHAHGETLELSQMEDLLDLAQPYSVVLQKMQEAFSASFGSMSEGNAQAPEAQPASQTNASRSTGKSR